MTAAAVDPEDDRTELKATILHLKPVETQLPYEKARAEISPGTGNVVLVAYKRVGLEPGMTYLIKRGKPHIYRGDYSFAPEEQVLLVEDTVVQPLDDGGNDGDNSGGNYPTGGASAANSRVVVSPQAEDAKRNLTQGIV